MEKILKKMAEAKKLIAKAKTPKQGVNSFSGYKYFTPEQVSTITQKVCEKLNMTTKFDMFRNELGIYATLTIFCLETSENLIYQTVTEIPTIKGANIAQQLGGAMTYTERYLKMTAFGIVDNNLDFDAKTVAPTENATKNYEKKEKEITWLTEEQFEKAMNSDVAGIEATLRAFSTPMKKMKREYTLKLREKLNNLKK